MTLLAVSIDEMKARGTITEADVLKLRRAFHADGRISPDEADALMDLNRSVPQHHHSWVECFVEMLTDYCVNQAVPEGYVTIENANWLIGCVGVEGCIATKAEFDLVVNVLDKSRWSPQTLVQFALKQVRDAIIDGTGPLRTNAASAERLVNDTDVDMLRRIVYAFGGDGNVAITQAEADVLFEINDATQGAANADSWRDLFVKAVANCVLTASGYTVPSREQALARDAWLDRRGDLSLGNMLTGMLSGYRAQNPEERAIARLERQKIEIVTGEPVTLAEAQWLAHRLSRDGILSANEVALLDVLKTENPALHPDLQAVVEKLQRAA
jgi:hypothetical protein